MDGHAIARGEFFPQFEIKQVVLGLDEAGLAVVAALDDVVGQTREIHPGTTGHGAFFVMVGWKTP